MHRGPPRRLPSSPDGTRMTRTPAASSLAFVATFRSWQTTSPRSMASALPPSFHCLPRAAAGSSPVSMTLSRSMPMAWAAASRNGCGLQTRRPARAGVMVCAVRLKASRGYMTTASVSTMLQTVSRFTPGPHSASGTASTVCASPASKTRRARRSTPAGVVCSPAPTASTLGASSSTSPPSACSSPGV